MGNHSANPPPPPPPTPPPTPHRPAGHGDAGPPSPPRKRGHSPPPPPGRTAVSERGAAAEPSSTPPAACSRRKRDGQANPRQHTRVQAERARGQQASTNRSSMGATPSVARATPKTPALLPAQGRRRDGPRQGNHPPHGPPQAAASREMARRPPPPHPPHHPAQKRPRRADPAHRERAAPSQVGGKRDRAAPPRSKPNGARDRGRTSRGAQTRGTALPAPSTGTARGARATPPRGGVGGARTLRQRERTHTQRTRGKYQKGNRTEPAERTDRIQCEPESEDKGHPDRTAHHTQREKRGAGRGKQGRHDTRHRPEAPNRPRALCTHDQGTAPAKAVVAHRATHQPQG